MGRWPLFHESTREPGLKSYICHLPSIQSLGHGHLHGQNTKLPLCPGFTWKKEEHGVNKHNAIRPRLRSGTYYFFLFTFQRKEFSPTAIFTHEGRQKMSSILGPRGQGEKILMENQQSLLSHCTCFISLNHHNDTATQLLL